MSTTPTVEEFLTSSQPDEPEEVEHPTDPLESIAHSMRILTEVVVRRDAEDEEQDSQSALVNELDRELQGVRAELAASQALVEEVLAICKPSTSKLANSIRAAIAEHEAVDEEPEGEVAYVCPHCGTGWGEVVDPCTECGKAASGTTPERPEQPAHDAPVEEWRDYVRAVRPAEFRPTTLDTMNRSQIRTYLGIEQVA